jgi:hypothetical protein
MQASVELVMLEKLTPSLQGWQVVSDSGLQLSITPKPSPQGEHG